MPSQREILLITVVVLVLVVLLRRRAIQVSCNISKLQDNDTATGNSTAYD